MGLKIHDVDKRYSPSPSAYQITNYNVGVNGSKWAFGSEKRQGVGKETLSPGPGAYKSASKAFNIEKPRFFMGEKIKDLQPTTKVPGSGHYDPKAENLKAT